MTDPDSFYLYNENLCTPYLAKSIARASMYSNGRGNLPRKTTKVKSSDGADRLKQL